MKSYRFVLRNNSVTSPQSVYVTARFGRNGKLMFSLPVKVEQSFWDSQRQRVKASRYCRYTDDVNAVLSETGILIERFLADSARSGVPVTKDAVENLLRVRFGRSPSSSTLHGFFELYISECDTRMNARRGGQNVTYKTKREYARTYELFRSFERSVGRELSFADVDRQMMQSFVAFLQGLDLATNTIAHKVISLKAVMREAVERGLTDNTRWHGFHPATEETEAVALDERELEAIRTCDLSDSRGLAAIRDLFLMECWTGLRYSDVTRLRAENIQGDFIVIQQQKTNAYVSIPVHPVFREIWERYGGVPVRISNQKFNGHIKEVCRKAGITESVLKSVTKGGRKVTESYEKWRLVSSHTGRRSFATNLYRSGFPSVSIMHITGHKTETAFLKYIKVSSQEHARLLAEHWRKGFRQERTRKESEQKN